MQAEDSKQYQIKFMTQSNPVQIQLPIMPTARDGERPKVLTIQSCHFQASKTATTQWFLVNGCDNVQLLFNNGSGCFDNTGRQTRLLEILTPEVTQIYYVPAVVDQRIKTWSLLGPLEPFSWTTGHDLELGFADINGNIIDFSVTGLNTTISILIKVVIG